MKKELKVELYLSETAVLLFVLFNALPISTAMSCCCCCCCCCCNIRRCKVALAGVTFCCCCCWWWWCSDDVDDDEVAAVLLFPLLQLAADRLQGDAGFPTNKSYSHSDYSLKFHYWWWYCSTQLLCLCLRQPIWASSSQRHRLQIDWHHQQQGERIVRTAAAVEMRVVRLESAKCKEGPSSELVYLLLPVAAAVVVVGLIGGCCCCHHHPHGSIGSSKWQ